MLCGIQSEHTVAAGRQVHHEYKHVLDFGVRGGQSL